jgi:hypothetical protein
VLLTAEEPAEKIPRNPQFSLRPAVFPVLPRRGFLFAHCSHGNRPRSGDLEATGLRTAPESGLIPA